MAFGMVIADRDEFYARGVVEPGFCWYVAAGPLLGSIGRDWFVGLPSGGLPVDFTRIGRKARIGTIAVPGRGKFGRIIGTVACCRVCCSLWAEAYRLVHDLGLYRDYSNDPRRTLV